MFKYLFDLSYDRTLDDAKVFYFSYFLFCYFIAGLTFVLSSIFTSLFIYFFTGIFLIPFIFYTFIAVSIVLKKNLRDRRSLYLVFYTIALTLFAPVGVIIILGGVAGWEGIDIKGALEGGFVIWFFPALVLGGIPAAFLSTKEDLSLNKEIQKMEQEKLEHELWVEKQLLLERAIASKSEEIKKHTNNTKEEEGQNEE